MQVCSLIYFRQRLDTHPRCNPSSHPSKVSVCMVKCSPRSVCRSRVLPGLSCTLIIGKTAAYTMSCDALKPLCRPVSLAYTWDGCSGMLKACNLLKHH